MCAIQNLRRTLHLKKYFEFVFLKKVDDTGDSFTLNCDPGVNCLNKCEWKLPQTGEICTIDSNTDFNDYICGSIKFVGQKLSTCNSGNCFQSCDIEIESALSIHEGMWTCTSLVKTETGKYVDTVNITFDQSFVNQEVYTRWGVILGISIPVGILLIVLLILLLIFCFCSQYLCCSNTKRAKKEVETPLATKNDGYAVPVKKAERETRMKYFEEEEEENRTRRIPRVPQPPVPPRNYDSSSNDEIHLHTAVIGRPLPSYGEYSRKTSTISNINTFRATPYVNKS